MLIIQVILFHVTSWEIADSITDEVIEFFSTPNTSSSTMVLWSTQAMSEMNTWNLPGSKGRLARKADKLTAICEPI
jgi:hypothetical protein